jgi:coenzyme F420-reducing hydrogenase delta subunit
MVPCVGRLGSIDLLAPFELGADRVVVISCKEDGCAFTGAEELFKRRIKGVKKFLDEIKVGQNNLLFFHTKDNAEESWPQIWEEARKEPTEASAAQSGS